MQRVRNLANAQISKKRGVVICSSVNPADYQPPAFPGVYHSYDIPFYFFDLRANASHRVRRFFATHPRYT